MNFENVMTIRLLITGGTIDKIYFDASSKYEVGGPQIDIVFREACVDFDYQVVSLMRKDSLEMDDDDLSRFARQYGWQAKTGP